MATYTNLTTNVRLSEEIVNPAIKGDYAIGIIGDGLNLQRAADFLTRVTSQRIEPDGNTYTHNEVTFQGRTVRVFYAGSTLPAIAFPWAGQLIGSLADAEARLIAMMESFGYASYKIIRR